MSQFEEMQTFIRVVESGSITKAAEQLDTVKSAVSRRLAELEKRLGVTLLTRTTRSQTLTESGQNYYQECVRILEDLSEVEAGIKDEHIALAGTIRISAPFSFGLKHLPPALREFNQRHPNIRFDLDFNDRKVDLIEERFDLAIRISRLADSSLIARKITQIAPVLCASPAYLEKHGTPKTIDDLVTGHTRLRYNLAPDTWQLLTKDNKEVTFKIPVSLSANNGDYLCEEAIAGRGLLFNPDFICYEAIKSGKLIPLLTDQVKGKSIDAYAVYPQTRHLSQRVRKLIDFLVDYYGDEPYWSV